MAEPIPGPKALPFFGNAWDLDPVSQVSSLTHLSDIYGPIYKLILGGEETYIVSSFEIYDELCDEKRFRKVVQGALNHVRVGLGSGLFTAWTHEDSWGVVHRALVPVFGPLAIHSMFDEMHDIATQMVMKWARQGPEHPIDPTDDFTRLTLDTIALCAMETRFNSFQSEELHIFPRAMAAFLVAAGKRSLRPAILQRSLYREDERNFHKNIKIMKDIAADIVKRARANPTGKKNILNAMLTRSDPKTGRKMTDEEIMDNMVTFIIAGHETTAGMLSFTAHHLCANPDVQRKVQQEIDEVVGDDPVTVEHTTKLPYLTAVLRESIRVTPTISANNMGPNPDGPDQVSLLGGKYVVPKTACFRVIPSKVMRDPAVWGDDAAEFKPERCLDENFHKIPASAWKPFGNGVRSCIGKDFAWQEAVLALALIFQNFDVRYADPSYSLKIKQTLTVKPDGLRLYAIPRKGVDIDHLESKINAGRTVTQPQDTTVQVNGVSGGPTPGKEIAIYWGGNSGTSEGLADRLSKSAAAHGFEPEIKELDSASNDLPKGKPVVIITSSYEGEPPDNAGHFVDYLENLSGKELEGVQYTVFGNGNHDWAKTYQRIPKLCDDLMDKHGATRFTERGEADVAVDDIFDVFETWQDKKLWPSLKGESAAGDGESPETVQAPSIEAEVFTSLRSTHLKQRVQRAIVVANKVLNNTAEASQKRHLELKLPTDATYRAGDYLAILPMNRHDTVKRVMHRFDLPFDTFIHIKSKQTTLPTDGPIPVADILRAYVELSQPATRKNITRLASCAHVDKEVEALKKLAEDNDAYKEVVKNHTSVLDLLEKYPSITMDFVEYLSLLPQIRLRQYSISSSPLANPGHCTLTVGVLDAPSMSDKEKRFYGTCSNYIAGLEPGDHVSVAVKQSNEAFHLPANAESTPIIMAASGTGIAPFRAFIQERAEQLGGGRKLAPALLFYGTQRADEVLYREELEKWHKDGAVDIRYAYSRDSNCDEAKGSKYVQDRFWNDREDSRKLFSNGAKIYICGSGRVGDGLKWGTIDIAKEGREKRGETFTQEQAVEWFEGLRNERYMADVFD